MAGCGPRYRCSGGGTEPAAHRARLHVAQLVQIPTVAPTARPLAAVAHRAHDLPERTDTGVSSGVFGSAFSATAFSRFATCSRSGEQPRARRISTGGSGVASAEAVAEARQERVPGEAEFQRRSSVSSELRQASAAA